MLPKGGTVRIPNAKVVYEYAPAKFVSGRQNLLHVLLPDLLVLGHGEEVVKVLDGLAEEFEIVLED